MPTSGKPTTMWWTRRSWSVKKNYLPHMAPHSERLGSSPRACVQVDQLPLPSGTSTTPRHQNLSHRRGNQTHDRSGMRRKKKRWCNVAAQTNSSGEKCGTPDLRYCYVHEELTAKSLGENIAVAPTAETTVARQPFATGTAKNSRRAARWSLSKSSKQWSRSLQSLSRQELAKNDAESSLPERLSRLTHRVAKSAMSLSHPREGSTRPVVA